MTQAEIDAGGNYDGNDEGTAFDSLRNVATADSNQTGEDTDDAVVAVERNPGIDVEKYVSVDNGGTWIDADTATGPFLNSGTSPQFKFVVTNAGNVTLTNITLTDSDFDLIGAAAGTSLTIASLAPGASTQTIITVSWAAGQHENTATVTAAFAGTTYTDSDKAHYYGQSGQPSIGVNTLSIVINSTRTTVTGQFSITDESEGTTKPDGFIIQMTSYGVTWQTKISPKTTLWSDVTPSVGCTYTLISSDYANPGWTDGDTILFDEKVTIGYTCTFGSKQLPKGGTLKGTARVGIFDRNGMEFTYSSTATIR